MEHVKKHEKNYGELFSKYAIYLVFVFMLILSTIMTDNFMKPSNLINILRQMAPVMIIACGETMVIIAGMTDLSPGAVLALSGCIGIGITQQTGNAFLGAVVAVVIGILAGCSCTV